MLLKINQLGDIIILPLKKRRENKLYINEFSFEKALPVWKKGDCEVKNQTLELVAKVKGSRALLRLAASTVCQVFVNGQLCSFGPARTAHGYYRCDELTLDGKLSEGENEVVIIVSGYNVNCYSYLDQTSFVCAEIVVNDKIVAYTCEKAQGFDAYLNRKRVNKVQRYSFQRAFCEAYRLGFDEREPIMLEECGSKRFIAREIPYGEYPDLLPVSVVARGAASFVDKENYVSKRFMQGTATVDGVKRKGYTEDELETVNTYEYEKAVFSPSEKVCEPADVIVMAENSYCDVDFEANRSGLISLEIEAEGDGTIILAFNESEIVKGDEPFSHHKADVITVDVKKGKHCLVTAEPYVFKCMRIVARGTAATVKSLKQISISFPLSRIKAKFVSDDMQMKKIYDAAINTFCDNTVDVYMDCPSRERAGWLCDSFFTARVEKTLTGASEVERAFLYNFLYHEKDAYLPDGMFPMCYPSDHYNGNFIPNWAMWYVLELKEYVLRSGDTQIVADAKDRMYALLDYFKGFENSDGLLEKLDGWIFIDWSRANDLVQDVSYGTNMTYAYVLDTVAELYGDKTLSLKAEAVRKVIREQAMTESGFFCDNAVRDENGVLKLSGERTEACQYYAFFTGTATPETYPELWSRLVNEFGFDRKDTGLYPDVPFANAFIANYIRLELLCRFGEDKALYDNIKGYFSYMAERTGTLWENNHDKASLNHGFASHVIYWMEKLGLVK